MSKNEKFQISSSNIIALWQLILLTKRHSNISVKSAMTITLNSGLFGGGIPAHQGLELGQHCKLLEINDSVLKASKFCEEELISVCDSDEPNLLVIRTILFRYISLHNFDWLLFFNDDPEIFKISIPDQWIELLDKASLFEFEDSFVRDWWGNIFSKFQTFKEGQKAEIGKIAEKLTYDFEKKRLDRDGLDNGHSFIKWASQINDKYGYDILSIRGNKLQYSFSKKDSIQIEVKCSVISDHTKFRFYVSKNEWTVAKLQIKSYYFYCWASASLNEQTATGPFIIPAEILESHIPTDNGILCEWSECKFILNLDELGIRL